MPVPVPGTMISGAWNIWLVGLMVMVESEPKAPVLFKSELERRIAAQMTCHRPHLHHRLGSGLGWGKR